ncbi:MAG: prepilin-type N-terminal cleavage/methylation domain-containing protein [Planctomycetota bacterium]|jgi:prepilin-type N-terminal cleavage/methylation domain-containing protein|nr:prepilin-type N-terminal cleavage/methylation domain-containing protein [Planctomycetota bacterium]
MRRTGFTLIELLVVVCIIAILAALLLPAIAMVRAKAQKIKCTSNLRQVIIATMGYTDDWNGFLPRLKRQWVPSGVSPTGPFNFFDAIMPYIDREHGNTHTTVTTVVNGCPYWPRSAYTGSTSTNIAPGYGMSRQMLPGVTSDFSLNKPGSPYTCQDIMLEQVSPSSLRAIYADADSFDINVHPPTGLVHSKAPNKVAESYHHPYGDRLAITPLPMATLSSAHPRAAIRP